MRDHSIGAFGGVALVLDLAVKIAALAALADRHEAVRYAVCAVAASRVAPVVLSAALPYARPDCGIGSALRTAGWVRCAVAAALAVLVCVLLGAPLVLLAVGAVTAVVGLGALAWLGGVTGDVLGTAAELSELAALVLAVALT
jgi:adenosylcobinamide-GDP ribazoletransferase